MDEKVKNNLKTAAFVVGFIFLMLMIVRAINDDSNGASSTPRPSHQSVSITTDQTRIIEALVKDGGIRFQGGVRVYVNPVFWSLCDAQKKENLAYLSSKYLASIRGDNSLFIDVYDMQTGKKIAKYDAWGFKVL